MSWSVKPALASVAATLFPRSCIICGTPLGPATTRGPSPLCWACEEALSPLPEPRCPRCGRPHASSFGQCPECRRRPLAFDEALPIYDFHGNAGLLIAAYKFGGRRSLAPWLAARLGETIAERWPHRVVVPVPPRKTVVAERGWDHVELLARLLQASGFAVARPLFRAPSRQQKELGLAERRENAAKAYGLRPGFPVPESVVLIDDVFTSGSTADACSRALKEGGAKAVAFVSIAAD